MKLRFLLLLLVIPMFIINDWYQNKDCCMCGSIENTCCPCPNTTYKTEIETYTNMTASSAGSWLYMCEEYKKAYNKTFECFE